MNRRQRRKRRKRAGRGVERAQFAAATIGSPRPEAVGANPIRASVRILRLLRSVLFKNPIELVFTPELRKYRIAASTFQQDACDDRSKNTHAIRVTPVCTMDNHSLGSHSEASWLGFDAHRIHAVAQRPKPRNRRGNCDRRLWKGIQRLSCGREERMRS